MSGRSLPRRLALLGGTTTLGDCAVAAGLLAGRGPLVDGPDLAAYEQEFARRVGVGHAVSVASGRVALYALLQAFGVGEGDEVLLQVPTHVVVPNAVRYLGARPVYVDCHLDSCNMDLDDAERKVTARTRALVLQHTFGLPADVDGALDLGRRHGIEVVEDCVHALGATYGGRPVGSHARSAFFSTEETKTITTVMGGMAVTDDADLAARLRAFQESCSWPSARLIRLYLVKYLLHHLLTEPTVYPYTRRVYEWTGKHQVAPEATSDEEKRGLLPDGYEQRLSNAQARLARRQLARLDDNVARRRAAVAEYARRLAPLGFAPPVAPPGADPAMVRYPVWVEDRDAALRATAGHFDLGKWFTSVLEESDAPGEVGYEPGSCPRAEAAARHLVNLPTHGRVGPADLDTITRLLSGLRPAAPVG